MTHFIFALNNSVFLHYLASTAFVDSAFGAGDGPIVYSNFGCQGFETSLSACSKDSYPSFTCNNGNTAGILCADGTPC